MRTPDLHLIDVPKTEKAFATKMTARIPSAEWLENPNSWNRVQFIKETADFLFEVYGMSDGYDKHLLSMLADHIDTYVNATVDIRENPIVIGSNGGATPSPNPAIAVRLKTTTLILQLMTELGLTPKARNLGAKQPEESSLGKLMKGPKAG